MRGIARQHEPSKDFYFMAIKQCEICSKDFYVKPKKYHSRFCCSLKCMGERFKETLKGENNPNFKNARETKKKECPVCGKLFFTPQYKTVKTCSVKCGSIIAQKSKDYSKINTPEVKLRMSLAQKKRHSLIPSKYTKNCECGKLKDLKAKKCHECYLLNLSLKKYKRPSCTVCGKITKTKYVKTCSKECNAIMVSNRYAGENNPNWKGGIRKPNATVRASDKYKEWRKGVFERDKYTCQECGQLGWELHAHHIKPFSKYPELRTELSNGITLCKKCHSNYHPSLKNLKY